MPFRFLKRLILLLLLLSGVQQIQAQIRPVFISDIDLTYINGGFAGFGIGIRSPRWEVMPSVLLGSGTGGKLEFRWYQTVRNGDRLQPYLSLEQIVFRQINTCVNNSCPFVLYQVLPGVGSNIRIWRGAQLSLGVACGLQKRELLSFTTDFSFGIGIRYEF